MLFRFFFSIHFVCFHENIYGNNVFNEDSNFGRHKDVQNHCLYYLNYQNKCHEQVQIKNHSNRKTLKKIIL